MSKLAELRQKKGLTQRELANRLGMTIEAFANWEHGRSGKKMFERFAKLCSELNCSPSDLVENTKQ